MSDATSDSPRRRLFDRVDGSPTLLGQGARFEGNLHAKGPVTVNGEIVGDGDVDGAVSIATGAHWTGNLRARNAVVAGRITGNVAVAEKLEIGKSAVIRGNVSAKSLAIAHGAVVEGEIAVTGSQPAHRFEERRASRLAE